MKKRRLTSSIAWIFCVLTSCIAQGKKNDPIQPGTTFRAGQIWEYANRRGEDSSTILILKVEKYDRGDTIIHIRVNGIKIRNPKAPEGYSNFIGHLPFSQKSVYSSVTNLAGTSGNLPDFSEGYNQWKEAWDSGKGGYWTVDVSEAIDGIDKAMQEKK